MAIQRNNKDERDTRVDTMIEQIRTVEERELLKRGVTLWTRTERRLGIVPFDAMLPPNKIN